MSDVQLLEGDCVELMKSLPDDSIDLVVTSPPYDDLRTYGGYTFDWQATFQQLYRVIVPGGVVVWVVADQTKKGSESGTSFRQALYAKDCGFNLLDTMIWVKDGGGGFGSINAYMQNTEYMFIFTKGKPKSVHLIRDHKNKSSGQVKRGHGRRFANGKINDEHGKERTVPEYSKRNNWWLMQRARGYGGHPATFPLQLAHDHIISWSDPGDTVLDCFMGSGTTGVACIQTGRNFIGMEINHEYFLLAQERLNALLCTTFTG